MNKGVKMKKIKILFFIGLLAFRNGYSLVVENISKIPTKDIRISLMKVIDVHGKATGLAGYQMMRFNRAHCLVIQPEELSGVGALRMVVYSPDRNKDGYKEMIVRDFIGNGSGYQLVTNHTTGDLELWDGAVQSRC